MIHEGPLACRSLEILIPAAVIAADAPQTSSLSELPALRSGRLRLASRPAEHRARRPLKSELTVSVRLDTLSQGLEVLALNSLSLQGSGRTGSSGGDSDSVLSDRSEHLVENE